MDFELTEFQTDLVEGVRRLCEGRFPLESLRTAEGSEQVVDRKGWGELGDAGLFNLCLAESAGGVGLGLPEAVLVFEELGRALVPGPLVASHLAAGLIDGAADGSAVVGLVERPVPGATIPLVVEHLSDLDTLLVLSDQGVAAVDPSTLDATAVHRPMDPLTPLWIVSALPDGTEVGGSELSARWRRDGALLTAALQVGLAGWSTDLATAYAKTRTQFGRVIGGFQAVKHICADMLVRAEVARVAVQAAAVTIAQPDVGDPQAASLGAKLLADEAALANGKSCIQVHGGMGFTWEVPAHLAFKRARVLATQFGTDDELAEWLGGSLAR
jgi:alkylation response protein AidB-like acyl-CoA dehydrogenase